MLENTLQKDNCLIHYWLKKNNNAPWVIFLHGAGADHQMFHDQLKANDKQFSTLVWDARGHGKSRPIGTKDFTIKLLVEDLVSIMEKEKIDKATFIGQSMGGNIAQEIAFYYPEKVESLILIDCTWNTQKLTLLEKWTIKVTPFILSIYPWKIMVKQSVKASSLKREVQAYLQNSFLSIGQEDFANIFYATAACLHTEENYHINKPMLIVCGEHDNTGNIKKIAPLWAKSEPNCEFHWIPNASHCANQDNPEVFNPLMTQFLQQNVLSIKNSKMRG